MAEHPVSDEPGDRRGQSGEEHRRLRRSRPGQASVKASLDSLRTIEGQKGKNALRADFQAGLVYIAAFGLEQGESLGALLAEGPVTPALMHLFRDPQGFIWLAEDDFVSHFAADINPTRARAMYAVQQPLAGSAFTEVMGEPAWKFLPSWYLVATNDQAIPPDAERQFARRMGATTVEVASSHLPMVSHPREVVELIESALAASQTAG